MKPEGRQTGERAHEEKDADVINLLMIALLLAVLIGFCLLVCWAVLRAFNHRREAEERPRLHVVERAARFPRAQLITQSVEELRRTQLAAETKLNTYGWVDRPAGIAHIPIVRAMELVVERGLPEVGEGQTRLQFLRSRPLTQIQPANPIASPAPEGTP